MCLGLGPGEFWASRNDFSKFEKMTPTGDLLLGNMWLLLRRMNACIDKFQPNTSQANYFEGFWRITSKTNTKIEVRKQFESCVPIQGGKTFCASFCASFIAGSRRAFLCVDCTVCLFVTERVLTKTEWNAQGVNVCSSKSLFTFVWFLFFVTWKLLWTRNNQC